MTPDTKYLSLEEVADLLGVNYQLIYRLVRSGELPAIRLGRVYRVASKDLDAYLEKSKTGQPGAQYLCASCGQSYASKLSVKESCAECGAPICTDCWTRKGLRYCNEHRDNQNEVKDQK